MCDFIGFELGVAAGNDQDRIRVLSPDTMNHLPVFMIGSIGHGAGVDDADIRLFSFSSTRMTARYQGLT